MADVMKLVPFILKWEGVDARDAVSLRESGGGCGDDKCRGEDCFSVFQDVLVHKLLSLIHI